MSIQTHQDMASLIAAERRTSPPSAERLLIVSSGVRGFSRLMEAFAVLADGEGVAVTMVRQPPPLHRSKGRRAPRARLSPLDHLRHRHQWNQPPPDPGGIQHVARSFSGALIAGTGPALSLLPTLAPTGVRTAVFTDVTAALHAAQNGWRDNRLLARDRAEEARRLALADRVLCLSEWCRASVLNDLRIDPDRALLMRQGINLPSPLPPLEPSRGSDRPLRIVCIGRPAERKGMDRLVNWLSSRPAAPVEVHFVGDAPTDLADSRITAHGWVEPERVLGLLATMDLLVHPTRRDQSANVVVEAGLAGVPSVVVADAGIPELIEEGVTGWMVPRGDDVALGEVLDRLVGDPSQIWDASVPARERAISRHDASVHWAPVAHWLVGRDR